MASSDLLRGSGTLRLGLGTSGPRRTGGSSCVDAEPIVGISKTTMLGKRARIALHCEHMARARELGVASQVRELSIEDITSAWMRADTHCLSRPCSAQRGRYPALASHLGTCWRLSFDARSLVRRRVRRDLGGTYVQPLYTRDLWGGPHSGLMTPHETRSP